MIRVRAWRGRLFWLSALSIATAYLAGRGSAETAGGTDLALDPWPAANLQNGWRSFMYVVTSQNRIDQNSHGMEGVGCAMRHEADGRGGCMHGMFAPDITYGFLSDPRCYQGPRGSHWPAYDEEAVKAAIAAGIVTGGKTLDPEMPRWTGLAAMNLEDLIGNFKRLGQPSRDQGFGS